VYQYRSFPVVDGCAQGSVVVGRSYANFNIDTGIKLQNRDPLGHQPASVFPWRRA